VIERTPESMSEFLQYSRALDEKNPNPEKFDNDSELAQFLGSDPGESVSSSLDNSGAESNYFPESHVTACVPNLPAPLAK
jgi:hypothetical protein